MIDEENSSGTQGLNEPPRVLFFRILLLFFCLLPIVTSEASAEPLRVAVIGTMGLFFLVTLVLSRTSYIEHRAAGPSIACIDAFILGIVTWLSQSIVYGATALTMLALSCLLFAIPKKTGLALLIGVIGLALQTYLPENLRLAPHPAWDGSWQSALSVCLALVASFTLIAQQIHRIGSRNRQIEELEAQQLESKFRMYQISKYMSPTLRKKLSSLREVEASTSRKKLSIFFSDLVGFTKMSEELEPADLNFVLNSYVTEMSDVAIKFGATIDKFMGDGMMAFFGDPKTNGFKEDAIQCVAMAMEMRRRMPKLRAMWLEQGIEADLHVRMGINSGMTTVGNFGSNDRLDYTTLGTEVNLASRLESNAETDGILISSSTCLLVSDTFLCESKGDIQVKGFSDPVPVYAVVGELNKSERAKTFAHHHLEGFSLHLDLDELPHYNRKKVHDALVEAAGKLKRHRN